MVRLPRIGPRARAYVNYSLGLVPTGRGAAGGGLVMLRSRTMKTSAAGRDGGGAETRPSKCHRGLVMLRARADKVRTSDGEGGDADLAAVMSDLLSLELEGIFRNVVSFL